MAVLRTDPTTLNLDSSMTGLDACAESRERYRDEECAAWRTGGVVIVPTASAVTDEIVSLLRAFVRRLARDAAVGARRRRRCRAASRSACRKAAGSRSCAASPMQSARSSNALESQRHELEQFLEQVTQQLAEFEDWTHWQAGVAQSRRDDTLESRSNCARRDRHI